jgi:hypothetical protein
MDRVISIVGLIIFCISVIGLSYLIHAWMQEKHKVETRPKIPMSMCDKHGAYPTSASLYIDVPAEDKPDLRVEFCPICYEERMKEQSNKIKQLLGKTNAND